MEETKRHTCLKLEIPTNCGEEPKDKETEPIFVKGTWFHTHFDLAITDGLNAWLCHASEEEVKQRATQWDQPVSEYVQLAERYLGFQQPGSLYAFADAGDGHKRLSWAFEKEGMTLQWRWKCMLSPNCKKTTAEILDFLMDANITLSDEVVRKTELFEQMKVEAEKCLAQSERITNEKVEFESEIYAKFLGVLNSKKSKLRELRDQLSNSKQETTEKSPQEEDTDKTESFDEKSDFDKSDEDPQKDITGSSTHVSASKPKMTASAFFVFMEEFRKEFNKEHPDNKAVSAVGKAAGAKWKSMSDAEKASYAAKSKKRKVEYEKDMRAYNNKQAEGPAADEEESKKSIS